MINLKKLFTGLLTTILASMLIFAGGAVWRVEALHTKVEAVEDIAKQRLDRVEAEQLYYRKITREDLRSINKKLDKLIFSMREK